MIEANIDHEQSDWDMNLPKLTYAYKILLTYTYKKYTIDTTALTTINETPATEKKQRRKNTVIIKFPNSPVEQL